jgi:hypothetical protein
MSLSSAAHAPVQRRGAPRRANVAHIRQAQPYFAFAFQTKVLQSFKIGPSSLGSGPAWRGGGPACPITVDRTWHTQDGQGHILAWAFRQTSFEGFKVSPVCADADLVGESVLDLSRRTAN